MGHTDNEQMWEKMQLKGKECIYLHYKLMDAIHITSMLGKAILHFSSGSRYHFHRLLINNTELARSNG